MKTWQYFLIIGISLLFEAFFSGTEIALVSFNRGRLKKMSKLGYKWAKRASYFLQHPDILFSTTLLGTNICVVTTTTIITIAVVSKYGHGKDWIAFAVTSPLILIIGELIPKTIFQRYSNSLVPYLIYPLMVARVIFYPVSKVVNIWAKMLQKFNNSKTLHYGKISRDDIRNLIEAGRRDINIKPSEKSMIRGVLDFSNQAVSKIMIPLVQVDSIDVKSTPEEAAYSFSQLRHTRMPVYSESQSNIIGLIDQKILFTAAPNISDISGIIKDAYYIPESQKAEQLFFHMHKNNISMAIVVDEFGGASGIITREDLFEEIVGDIEDEYDSSEPQSIYQTHNKIFMIKGNADIDDINDQVGCNLPKGNYVTVAGFLLDKMGRIPKINEEFIYENVKLTVKQANSRQVFLVQITFVEE